MLDEQQRDNSRAPKRAVPTQQAMTFAPEGLVLGAGTVVLQMDGPRRVQSLRGREARVLAFLCAFHGSTVEPRVLGNIERAAKAWSEGDKCLAYIHLAHASLSPPQDFRSGAYRRVLSDGNVAIDAAAVSPDLVDEDEPKLCPDPTKDRRTNDRGQAIQRRPIWAMRCRMLLNWSFSTTVNVRPVQWSRLKTVMTNFWRKIGGKISSHEVFETGYGPNTGRWRAAPPLVLLAKGRSGLC